MFPSEAFIPCEKIKIEPDNTEVNHLSNSLYSGDWKDKITRTGISKKKQLWPTFSQKSVSSRMARFPREVYDERLGPQHLIHTNLCCLITAACWVFGGAV